MSADVCMSVCHVHVRVCVYRKLIVDNFIPVTEVEKLKGRAVLNESTDEWTLTPAQAPNRSDIPRTVCGCTLSVTAVQRDMHCGQSQSLVA